MDNPYWYSEKHSHVIDISAIRLNAFHLMNIFFASQTLASEHRLDDSEDNLANLYCGFYRAEITRLLINIAINTRVFDDQMKSSDRKDKYLRHCDRVDTGDYIGIFQENEKNQEKFKIREACNKIIHAETVRPIFERGDFPHYSIDEIDDSDEDYEWWYLTGEIEMTGSRIVKGETVNWFVNLFVPPYIETVIDLISFKADE
ncbi:hypothetical protein ACE1AT_14070 [Pelatocladus sp. BLCC-F211]|uniref:hypothetical protein n=1 Tax=Pelatocladus sp. BLCC-F211 TaxID=3342752 RepID=UPI0035B90402